MKFFIVKMYKTYHKNIPNYNIQKQRCFYIETGWTQKTGCSNDIDYSESNLFKSKNSSSYIEYVRTRKLFRNILYCPRSKDIQIHVTTYIPAI